MGGVNPFWPEPSPAVPILPGMAPGGSWDGAGDAEREVDWLVGWLLGRGMTGSGDGDRAQRRCWASLSGCCRGAAGCGGRCWAGDWFLAGEGILPGRIPDSGPGAGRVESASRLALAAAMASATSSSSPESSPGPARPAGWLGLGAGCGACPRRLLGGCWSTSITSMCSSSESLESEADGCLRPFSRADLPPSSCSGSLLMFVDCPVKLEGWGSPSWRLPRNICVRGPVVVLCATGRGLGPAATGDCIRPDLTPSPPAGVGAAAAAAGAGCGWLSAGLA